MFGKFQYRWYGKNSPASSTFEGSIEMVKLQNEGVQKRMTKTYFHNVKKLKCAT